MSGLSVAVVVLGIGARGSHRAPTALRVIVVVIVLAGLVAACAIWLARHPKRARALDWARTYLAHPETWPGLAREIPKMFQPLHHHPSAEASHVDQYLNVWKARYVESSVPLGGARKDRPTSKDTPNWAVSLNRIGGGSLQTDRDAITFRAQKNRDPILSLNWASIVDIRVADATAENVHSRTVRERPGFHWMRTVPVSKTQSRRLKDAYVEIESTEGTFLFRLLPGFRSSLERIGTKNRL